MSAYVVLIERLRDEKVTANSKEGSLGISDEIKESVKIQNYVVTAFLWIMVVTTAVNVYFLCN